MNKTLTNESESDVKLGPKELGIKIEFSPTIPLHNSDNNVYLIRHGFSTFNRIVDEYRHRNSHKGLDFYINSRDQRFSKDYLDCPLDELGILQAQYQQKILSDENISLVLVSPMLRTLQTADLLFDNHKNRKNLKIKVVPYLHEGLLHSCSLALNTNFEIRKEFEAKGFDFSEMDKFQSKIIYQVEMIKDQDDLMRNLYSELKNESDLKKCTDTILEYMKRKEDNKHIENAESIALRATYSLEILEREIKDTPKDSKVCIISHYLLLRNITKLVLKRNNKQDDINKYTIKNCEINPIKLDRD